LIRILPCHLCLRKKNVVLRKFFFLRKFYEKFMDFFNENLGKPLIIIYFEYFEAFKKKREIKFMIFILFKTVFKTP
jgi:hypothetical protein